MARRGHPQVRRRYPRETTAHHSPFLKEHLVNTIVERATADQYELRLRTMYQQLRTIRDIVEVLRSELIKTQERVAALEGVAGTAMTSLPVEKK
jgi:hypothetical protein